MNPIPEMAQMKIYIKDELEQLATLIHKEEMLNPDFVTYWSCLMDKDLDKKIEIANIAFSFDFKDSIGWLKERGNYIREQKWDEVVRMN